MRPDRFTQLLLAAARTIPDVTSAEPVPSDERHKRPYLVAIQAGGKTTRWQVVATMTMPAGSPEHLEQALIAAVLEADSGEIAAVDLYSRRPEPPAVGHGATILFHNGSKIYLNRAH